MAHACTMLLRMSPHHALTVHSHASRKPRWPSHRSHTIKSTRLIVAHHSPQLSSCILNRWLAGNEHAPNARFLHDPRNRPVHLDTKVLSSTLIWPDFFRLDCSLVYTLLHPCRLFILIVPNPERTGRNIQQIRASIIRWRRRAVKDDTSDLWWHGRKRSGEIRKAGSSLGANSRWAGHRLQDTLWEKEMNQIINVQLTPRENYCINRFLVTYMWHGNIIKPMWALLLTLL